MSTALAGNALSSVTVQGGGATPLNVVSTGNPNARAILFIHGFSQSLFAWRNQLESDLASEFHLVALDLRGHGRSGKPEGAYANSSLWADDIHSVIGELQLKEPVLCGWSYGAIVILDYLRQYGEDAIGGFSFVDGITKLGSEAALSVLTPELLGLVPGFFSNAVNDATCSMESLLKLCFVNAPSTEDLYLMLGYNLSVPPHVRQALFSRSLDNDDVMTSLRKPALIIHGAADAVVKSSVVDQHSAALRQARTIVMPNAGHAPFWDDPSSFNAHLRAFCRKLR